MDMNEQHQRLLNGPNANRHMSVVWPEVVEHRRPFIRISRLILDLLALTTIVVASFIALMVF
jgi:hypothetical protein